MTDAFAQEFQLPGIQDGEYQRLLETQLVAGSSELGRIVTAVDEMVLIGQVRTVMRKQQILVEDMLSVYVLRRIGTKGRPDIQVVQRILIAARQSERLGTGQKHLLAAKQRNLRIRKPCLSLHVIHLEVLVELGDNERIVARLTP